MRFMVLPLFGGKNLRGRTALPHKTESHGAGPCARTDTRVGGVELAGRRQKPESAAGQYTRGAEYCKSYSRGVYGIPDCRSSGPTCPKPFLGRQHNLPVMGLRPLWAWYQDQFAPARSAATIQTNP